MIIVNPQSQGGALGRQWPHIRRVIRRHFPFGDLHTKASGEATQLTREALLDGAEQIVAIGGDGTINEVVNGFFSTSGASISSQATLGIIPFGTGGDFRRSLHIPADIDRAAQNIVSGKQQTIDLGKVEYDTGNGETHSRWFANIASFGISGVVDRYVNRSSKRLGGRISFLLATARASFTYQNQRVRLVFDNDPSSAVDITMNTVAIANGCYFGGGMHIAPKALLDDGLFDIVALGDLNWKDLVTSGIRVYHGTHLDLAKVTYRRAQTLRAEPIDRHPVELDVDGEAPGILPATFSLVPKALKVIA